jgi:hypothetical protein
MNIIPKL